jgi:hypothetical protein
MNTQQQDVLGTVIKFHGVTAGNGVGSQTTGRVAG